MTRWSLLLQTLSLLQHFLGLYYAGQDGDVGWIIPLGRFGSRFQWVTQLGKAVDGRRGVVEPRADGAQKECSSVYHSSYFSAGAVSQQPHTWTKREIVRLLRHRCLAQWSPRKWL